jgi:wyosine [tRNA(Phe)-imidazoG37] synthetase (radical SAM superfamily)
MDCYVNAMVFLRANGSLACGCDVGGTTDLQKYNPALNYYHDVLNGPIINKIRDNLSKRNLPYPNLCDRCWLLNPDQDFDISFIRDKTITYFQIEPSILCNLHCPSCIPHDTRKNFLKDHGYGNLFLRNDIVKKILSDLKENNVIIKRMDFIGHGEPQINPELWEMIKICRDLFPETYLILTTNANSEFKPHHVTSGLNQIIFSVDGTFQEAYGKYRVGGDFNKAFEYMKKFSDCCEEKQIPVYRVWKYVVFDHNDSLSELINVQKMASEIKLQAVHYVFTMWGPRSCKIFSPDEIPHIDKKINVIHNFFRYSSDSFEKMAAVFEEKLEQNDMDNANNSFRYVVNALYRDFDNEQVPLSKEIVPSIKRMNLLIQKNNQVLDPTIIESFNKFIQMRHVV